MRVQDGGLRLLSAAGVAWLALGASPVTTSTTGQTQGRPNIVLIVADDHRSGSTRGANASAERAPSDTHVERPSLVPGGDDALHDPLPPRLGLADPDRVSAGREDVRGSIGAPSPNVIGYGLLSDDGPRGALTFGKRSASAALTF